MNSRIWIASSYVLPRTWSITLRTLLGDMRASFKNAFTFGSASASTAVDAARQVGLTCVRTARAGPELEKALSRNALSSRSREGIAAELEKEEGTIEEHDLTDDKDLY